MAFISRVAPAVIDSFTKLESLSDSTFEDFMKVLRDAEVEIHPGRLVEQISSKVRDISYADIQDIFLGISTIRRFQKEEQFNFEDLFDGLLKSINEKRGKENKIDVPIKVEIFKRRILDLLDNEVLTITEAVFDNYYSHEKLFSSVDTQIDVRPIYCNGKANYAVLSGSLKIAYRYNDKLHRLFLAIDRNDIKILKKAINEFEEKLKIYESLIENMKVKELKLDK